jgi:hypothetical protein
MKRILKILAIVVVLVLAGTYGIYLLDYKGNYNLNVQVQVNLDDNGGVSFSQFSSDSEPTSVVQFWDVFRAGHSDDPTTRTYKVVMVLNQSGESVTIMANLLIANGESKMATDTFENVPVGEYSLTVSLRSGFPLTTINEKTYSVVVG